MDNSKVINYHGSTQSSNFKSKNRRSVSIPLTANRQELAKSSNYKVPVEELGKLSLENVKCCSSDYTHLNSSYDNFSKKELTQFCGSKYLNTNREVCKRNQRFTSMHNILNKSIGNLSKNTTIKNEDENNLSFTSNDIENKNNNFSEISSFTSVLSNRFRSSKNKLGFHSTLYDCNSDVSTKTDLDDNSSVHSNYSFKTCKDVCTSESNNKLNASTASIKTSQGSSIRNNNLALTEDICDENNILKTLLNDKQYRVYSFCILILLMSVIIGFKMLAICKSSHAFGENSEFNLQKNLTTCLIGHDKSVSYILDSFNFSKKESNFSVLWLVGSRGIGKSYIKYLIRSSFNSTNFAELFVSLISKNSIADEVKSIAKNLDYCRPNIIFIDEFDEMNEKFIEIFQVLFDEISARRSSSYYKFKSKVIIILIGNYGHKAILSHTKEMNKLNESKVFSIVSEKILNLFPYMQYSEYFDLSVIPLFPLKKSDLELCVHQSVNFYADICKCCNDYSVKTEIFLKSMNKDIMEIHKKVSKLINPTNANYLPFGCKRVYSLVSLLLHTDVDKKLETFSF